MIVRCIYIEVSRSEVWICECEEGKFYINTFPDYRIVHWNYPEITPTQELFEKAKIAIEQKKLMNKRRERVVWNDKSRADRKITRSNERS